MTTLLLPLAAARGGAPAQTPNIFPRLVVTALAAWPSKIEPQSEAAESGSHVAG